MGLVRLGMQIEETITGIEETITGIEETITGIEEKIAGIEEDEEDQCSECGSQRHSRDYKRAEVVCSDCGLVMEDRIIDLGPDRTGFDNRQRMAREHTGPPATYIFHDMGISAVIDPRDYDAGGSPLKPQVRAQMDRLRKWDRRARISGSVERNLSYALSELDRVAGQLRLPRNVREAASLIYRRTVEKGLTRGRSMETAAASAIYISCRQFGIPRTLNEMTEVTRCNRKEIGKSYRVIVRDLGIHLPPVNATDYVPRFTSLLGLSGTTEIKAVEILRQVVNEGMGSGKSPAGTAAAAIYTACLQEDANRTQIEISEVAGVTEVTVRNRYKDIAEYLNLEAEPEAASAAAAVLSAAE
jgi:transcription initiation factor TFIIB